MRSIYLFVASVAASACLAAPVDTCLNSVYNWTPRLAHYYAQVSKHIDAVGDKHDPPGRAGGPPGPVECDVAGITLPAYAAGLPSPSGQTPKWAAVGRGVQNYTCATSTADSKPVAVGALASLFDATCIAANYPDIMAILPDAVVSIPVPTGPEPKLLPANIDLLGHHYFQEKIPVFNLDTTPQQQNGLAFVTIGDKIQAPVGSYPGANNQGAVAWLYLPTQVEGTVGKYSSVYRVNTAGGSPPPTCEGMPAMVSVDYAANYYFFDF